ncbi:MAG TPA: adenosylmethionine--8-amino-7-oxononanoate transaminase [Polyangiaceae bacterium]|jgi:adenosylmethionine-8-amino-7-oxononanoate aminotransferase|nr:adenosylmethionine--8-amino-7-oxononanoate transaminase [Polyangiaceae bacterium]
MKDLTREHVIALDKAHVWHPYTAMDEYVAETNPLVVSRASGCRLFDADGRVYIDGNASWWCCALGHNHPRLVRALTAQAERLSHVALGGMTHEPVALLAKNLVAVVPAGLEHVFFSDDGSTSVEVALKMSLQYWAQNGRPERTRFVAFEGAYHGDTLGTTGLGGVELFRRPFASVIMDCLRVPAASDGYERAFAALEALLVSNADRIAAVVLEPMVQGAAGMRMYDAEFLRRARALTTKHDVFLVLDEVFTGYGRTGPMWASGHAGIAPDLMCTSKGFTGGMLPMSATLATRRIFEGFFGGAERSFFYGHTFTGNPLGAAVALEVLRVYEEECVLERATAKAARIRAAFAEFSEIPGVMTTRSLGMIGALELEGRRGYLERGGLRVYHEALRRGAYLRPMGNVVYITPALNIGDADLDELLGIVAESVRTVTTSS